MSTHVNNTTGATGVVAAMNGTNQGTPAACGFYHGEPPLLGDELTKAEGEIEELAEAAMKGHTEQDRQTALVTLLQKLSQLPRLTLEDTIVVARDAATKNAFTLYDQFAATISGPNDVTERIDDLARRAQAILDDTSGQYNAEAQLSVAVLLCNPNTTDAQLRAQVEKVEGAVFKTDRSGNGRHLQDPPEHEPGDAAPIMSDERISEVTGRIQKSVDSSLRTMADAIRGGKCPGDAFQDVMSAFLNSGRDIPRHEYDGMTHTEWWSDKERRAEAIMADESGRYADSTKAAIKLVYTEMKTPGNEKTTALGWREYGDWIKRAEAGEVLDAASESGEDETKASSEVPDHAGKVLLHDRQIDELIEQTVSAMDYEEASGAPFIAILRYLQLAATGELYQDGPRPIEWDAGSLVRRFMRGIMAHTLDDDDLASFGERALSRLASQSTQRSASTETRAYAREASDTIPRRSELDAADESAEASGEFDPVEAIDELVGQISGSLTPEKYADQLYSLIVYARDNQGALEGAILSGGLDNLIAHTTRGRQLERELEAAVSVKGGR